MKTILIYEDNEDLRESLIRLIATDHSFEVIGEYENCLHAGEHVQEFAPDMVLMDIDMPGITGIEGVRNIKAVNPDVSVLMLTVFDDNDRVFQAIEAGASGYLLKKTSPDRILEALHELAEGGAPMTASVARKVLESFQVKRKDIKNAYHLTSKEKEILQSLVEGNSYKMIASLHHITIHTVRNHIRSIYEKLHVNSATEAVSKAINKGLL